MDEITYAVPDSKQLPQASWRDAYGLLLACSQAHSPRAMAVALLDSLRPVCPYDSAAAIFTDVNGEITGWYSAGVGDEYLNMSASEYHELMRRVSPTLFQRFNVRESSPVKFSLRVDWTQVADSAYRHEFLQPIGAVHSWYFCFFDMLGIYRVTFLLNRATDDPFKPAECAALELALPVLNNMHRNFFYRGRDSQGGDLRDSWGAYGLTPRETEICDLLCQGMAVKTISSVLFISASTTYKHLAHIYQKVGVGSQHELVSKLLGS